MPQVVVPVQRVLRVTLQVQRVEMGAYFDGHLDVVPLEAPTFRFPWVLEESQPSAPPPAVSIEPVVPPRRNPVMRFFSGIGRKLGS